MKVLSLVALSVLAVAGSAGAATWSAKLLDAGCADKNIAASSTHGVVNKKSRESFAKTCAPTAGTTAYAIQTNDGHVYKLDPDSNAKATSAYSSGAFKPDGDGDVHATVTGTLQGDTIKADTIKGRGEPRR